MNPTITESKRARRRTFKEVATAAHAKGWSEGREQGRKDVEKDYDLLLATNLELGRSVMALENNLSKINGSLITALRYWAKGHV
jgi:flagellar biosynthesis/type III secretory pathway protein FliH